MNRCKKCGQLKVFFQLNNDGLCKNCAAIKAVQPIPNRTYHVVGLKYYKDGIKRALVETDDFRLSKKDLFAKFPAGSKIPQYDKKVSYPAQLIPEPTNPYDKNAIMVVVNGEKIGHIKRGTAAQFDVPLNMVTSTFAKVKESPYKEITQGTDGKYHCSTSGDLEINVTLSFH